MSLSTLAIILGLGFGIPHLFGFFHPETLKAGLRRFPRSLSWGYPLMLLATAWFLYNLKQEQISDFEPYKPFMLIGFGVVGVGACFFLQDFLAVRALSVLFLLLAKVMLDTAQWIESDTPWRLVIVVWAYAWILVGMWLTISPWRLRDFFNWIAAHTRRLHILCGIHLALGLLVALLGIIAYR